MGTFQVRVEFRVLLGSGEGAGWVDEWTNQQREEGKETFKKIYLLERASSQTINQACCKEVHSDDYRLP